MDNVIKSITLILMLSLSALSYAIPPKVDMNCLKKEHGQCVSLNEHMMNSTVDILSKVPATMGEMLFGRDTSQDLPAVPLKGRKSLSECMKDKHTIDNDVLRCRNGL